MQSNKFICAHDIRTKFTIEECVMFRLRLVAMTMWSTIVTNPRIETQLVALRMAKY